MKLLSYYIFMSKILAIDYGEKRVGLATAISELKVALPFGIIENNGIKKLIADIREVCRKEEITQIIVGFPMGLGGTKTKQTEKTEKFIANLKQNIEIPVEIQNEVFTSRQAHGIFKDAGVKKKRIDESAATLILEDYLQKTDI
jgi:putative Holliday junction resolvase